MIKAAVAYRFLTKGGSSGGGRAFCDIPRSPITKTEFLQLEEIIAEANDFENVYIINIIPLAEEDEK